MIEKPNQNPNLTYSTITAHPVQEQIPPTKALRNQLFENVRDYVGQNHLTGPLTFEELRLHTQKIIKNAKVSEKFGDLITILINNETWRDTLAGIPFQKRLLLLPKCLRLDGTCSAQIDEFGLICNHCGSCVIDDLQTQAEQLGYVVMVAEGSPVVMALIESGQVEAIVGVSCMSVLEEVFPYMEAGAVPGIAIPLLYDGCKNTNLDIDWLWDAIHVTRDDETQRLNLEAIREQVDNWFTPQAIQTALDAARNSTEKIAHDWLTLAGKRWRPFLTAAVFTALQEKPDQSKNEKSISESSPLPEQSPPEQLLPESIRKLLIAVECFHKASLIHDDIEDNDSSRYGRKTLHAQHGVPIALNIGDFLLGEGYRLIAELDIPTRQKNRMLQIAATGHRTLCIGQGDELYWRHHRRPLSPQEVLEIFRQKTAPAFEVALQLGVLFAQPDPQLAEILTRFSQALGIAYQIHDDILDFDGDSELSESQDSNPLSNSSSASPANSPSLLLALTCQNATSADRKILEKFWLSNQHDQPIHQQVKKIITKLKIETHADNLLEHYKSQAIRCLIPIKNPQLKAVLRRVVGKIFHDIVIMSCCDDHQRKNASRGRGCN